MSAAALDGVTQTVDPVTDETVISVALSPAVTAAVILDLRPHHAWLDHETAKREKVDITIGDPEVDRRYHIEAAPSELMREALDDELRAFLVDADPCRLVILNRTLRFSRANLPPLLLERALAVLPRLADTFEALVKAAQVMPVSVDGDPYRGGVPSKALEKRRRRADLEVRRLRWLRKTPTITASFIVAAIASLVGVGYAFVAYPFLVGAIALVVALPVWFFGGILVYMVLTAVGAITGITGIYHRMGHRKFDALEAKAHEPPDP